LKCIFSSSAPNFLELSQQNITEYTFLQKFKMFTKIAFNRRGAQKQYSAMTSYLTHRSLSTGDMFYNPSLNNVIIADPNKNRYKDMAPLFKEFANAFAEMWKQSQDNNAIKLSFIESPEAYLIEAGPGCCC
jgi:hypothetical protein